MFADGKSGMLLVQQLISQSVRTWLQPLKVLDQEDSMEVPKTESVLACRAALCPSVSRSTRLLAKPMGFPRERTNVQTLNCEQETETCIFLSGHFST